ncbi:kinesin motor protein cin8, partial [Irineochytrium annulatum]
MSSNENIHVVVRIRPRNAKELKENSPVFITTAAAQSKELTVRSQGEGGSKTYHFDKVFGPQADQELLFTDVVAPMLDEVLQGYNCTIFAYGQTGTGKTYTMEGDLESVGSRDAGIIPRALRSLFDILQRDDSEYSVKISFIEIYNEELRDLLSLHNDVKLKIYEDNFRKGFEEHLVTNVEDVIAIMQQGSHKRQVAATKMNETAHQKTETELNSLASGLVATLRATATDVDGLHRKIARKSKLEQVNMKIFRDFQGRITKELSDVSQKIGRIRTCSQKLLEDMHSK